MSTRGARASADSIRSLVSLRAWWKEVVSDRFLTYIRSSAMVRVLLSTYEITCGLLSNVLFLCLMYFFLWSFTGEEAVPPKCLGVFSHYPRHEHSGSTCVGGKWFNIFAFYVIASLARHVTELIGLPGSMGMVVSAMVLHEYSYSFNKSYDKRELLWTEHFWLPYHVGIVNTDTRITAKIRQIALATILLRAGLHVDPAFVRRVKGGVARMPVIPCLIEACIFMPVAWIHDQLYTAYAPMSGFALAATSSVVFVPTTMQLTVVGWSLDNVIVIIGFGVAHSAITSQGKFNFGNPMDFLRYLVIGAAIGICIGLLIFFFPHPGMKYGMVLRCSCLFLVTVLIIGTSVKMNVLYAGVLACFLVSFTLQMGFRRGWTWRLMRIRDESLSTTATTTRGSSRATSAASSTFLDAAAHERDVADLKTMRSLFETLWWLLEPLVFAYIGADYPLSFVSTGCIENFRNCVGKSSTFSVQNRRGKQSRTFTL